MKNDFITIDVETANADLSSICQIGIAKYSNSVLIDEWSSLINPKTHFDFWNIRVHKIEEEDVMDSPTFPEIIDYLKEFMNDTVCVSHTAFDKASIQKALAKHGLRLEGAIWLDSARIARRTWEQFSKRGYGLANVCDFIGYEFKHHDALEDAKASGKIMIAAMQESGKSIDDWLIRVNQPIAPRSASTNVSIAREGNPEGDLIGEVVCFTGSLVIPRSEAADLASSIGCTVTSGVSKKTTMLIVGDQDLSKLAGKAKSSKHLKAEQFIEDGQNIRIIMESDFLEMVSMSTT